METKRQSFVKGAAILAAAGIIVKILGGIYRIPLGRIISSEGMGYYQTAYDVYSWGLIMSAYAIPTAISKLTSEKYELGRADEAQRIFRVAMLLMIVLGSALSLAMFFYSDVFARAAKNPGASMAILYVAPSILLFSINGAYRGYFQGMQNMVPSAISQVGEQLGRVIFGFALAIIFLPMGYKAAAAGTIIGTSIGGLISVLILIFIYYRHRSKDFIEKNTLRRKRESTIKILKSIIAFSVPIAIGGSIIPIMNLLDSVIVMDRLQAVGYTYETAVSLLGQLKGMAGSFVNLPQVLTVSLAASLVPAISESMSRKDYKSIQRKSELGIRISVILGLPSAAGLFILAGPIMTMFYPDEPATLGAALQYLAPTVIFLTLYQTLTGVLQGIGKVRIPLINLAVGAAAKILITYYATSIPSVNIKGAAIGTFVGYAIACTLNMRALIKFMNNKLDYYKMFVKPIIATAVMTAAAYFTYSFVYRITSSNTTATLSAIISAAIIYGILLLSIKAITIEELQMAPGGNRLSAMLKKQGIK